MPTFVLKMLAWFIVGADPWVNPEPHQHDADPQHMTYGSRIIRFQKDGIVLKYFSLQLIFRRAFSV
jgi:hypothetical protein